LKNSIVFNDPVYGFISVKNSLIIQIIEHPFFQRLRRIRQLGVADLIYQGANHTRFQHALGAMHLAGIAMDTLKSKGIEISEEEYTATKIGVLLHDVGHGPFSHALEFSLLKDLKHESLSYQFMKYFNELHGGKLDLTLKIFRNSYSKKFLNQLISSQLDTDRLDYLHRDSFFTGVSEGNIGVQRILQLLNVVDNELVIEEKAIYNIENFLNARRVMYWQVYLHKTCLSVEKLLVNIIMRAKDLIQAGIEVPGSSALQYFLKNDFTMDDFNNSSQALNYYGVLDDTDIWGAIKIWSSHQDPILKQLCDMMISRNIFKVTLGNEPIEKSDINKIKKALSQKYNVPGKHTHYFMSFGEVSNKGYIANSNKINILTKKNQVIDVADFSDLPNIKAISKIVKKYYLCWPKNI